jgi:peptidoglycan hydrolase CwlO-like protein
MSLHDLPISETLTGFIAAVIAWITGGKYAAKSAKIDSTAKLIALWEQANHNCQSELEELRAEIKQLRSDAAIERERSNDEISKLQSKVKVLENHIKKLEKA